ncbi:MAG: hypothetical protein R3C19_24240 [Planctomycetaceae bacterium]
MAEPLVDTAHTSAAKAGGKVGRNYELDYDPATARSDRHSENATGTLIPAAQGKTPTFQQYQQFG